ncbi:LysR family transcriptional regulator [Streptomyces sp. NPDC048496]|uniref:LysR family transcriptional regulator n=1 Tax=Streptomyces sp. NPDC048496 TaxID=3365558 RepID=UPI003723C17B
MDLDLAQVRAFTAVAESLHFGSASARLGITQQALSKRIARLEVLLGVRLFERGQGKGVRLTEAGERFLAPARQTLSAGDLAVAAALGARRRLRIDVWGHLYGPMRTLAQVVAAAPGLDVEPGTGRDFPSVTEALRRSEVGAGFGRVPSLRGRAPAELAHRLVRLEPVDAVVSAAHPLAAAPELRPSDLRTSVLRYPADGDRLDFLTHFAEQFGVSRWTGGPNLGLAPFLAHIRDDPSCFSLFPADAVSGDVPGVRFIPLIAPTPLYAWSLVWSVAAAHEHPVLGDLLQAFAQAARQKRWLEFDPARDWLPGTSGVRPGSDVVRP